MSGVKFSPGNIVATPGALEAFRASGDDPLALVVRHLAGDWGDVDEHDRPRERIRSHSRVPLALSLQAEKRNQNLDHHGS